MTPQEFDAYIKKEIGVERRAGQGGGDHGELR